MFEFFFEFFNLNDSPASKGYANVARQQMAGFAKQLNVPYFQLFILFSRYVSCTESS